jgi:hypothetical protein
MPDDDSLSAVLAQTEATLARTRAEVDAHERLQRERVEALEGELGALTGRRERALERQQPLQQTAERLEAELHALEQQLSPKLAQLRGRERFAAASWSLVLLLLWGALVTGIVFYWQGRFRVPALAALALGLAAGWALSRLRTGARR